MSENTVCALPIDLLLPKGFFEKEVRDGYVVTPKLKKIWAIELDLLDKLMNVCRKYDIKFQIFGGSLLGAVRHRGFIPWDDDLDIGMTREELNKLIRVSGKEFTGRYFLQTGLNDSLFFLPYARLRNSETTGAIAWQDSSNYNNGIYVDIYILEGCEKSIWLSKLHDKLLLLAAKPLTLYFQDRPRNNSFREKILRLPRPLIRLLSYAFWYRLYSAVLGLATRWTERIGIRCQFTEIAQRYWLTKTQFRDSIELPFEFMRVPAARAYDEILKHMYGEYTKFPPESERGVWHEGSIHFDPDLPYKEYFAQKAKHGG